MKTILKLSAFFILSIFLFQNCEKDGIVEGPPPTGENLSLEIMASPGDEITFIGTFADENGFTSITLSNEELLLDKTINFANHVEKYFLEYKFTIPADAALKTYHVLIVAEDLAGDTISHTTTVNVATSPTSDNMVTLFNASPGDEITILGTINDDQGISSISLINQGIELDDLIETSDLPKSYELAYTYKIPETAEQRGHDGKITVTNVAGRSTTFAISVNLSGGEVVYDNVYVAGSFQWWAWDPTIAYPMEKVDDMWFSVDLHCWDEYDELKFIGQLDWAPDNWGLVDQADPSKGMLNDESSAAVLLGANGGNPAYKTVRFNPYEMKYEVEDFTNNVEPREEVYIVGKGFPDYPALDWNPDAAIKMDKNPDGWGEHIYVIYGLQFSDAVDLKFIGQNTGWGPYDAGFEVGGQMVAPVNWAKVQEGDGTADLKFTDQAGYYTIVFDYYLKRASILKEE